MSKYTTTRGKRTISFFVAFVVPFWMVLSIAISLTPMSFAQVTKDNQDTSSHISKDVQQRPDSTKISIESQIPEKQILDSSKPKVAKDVRADSDSTKDIQFSAPESFRKSEYKNTTVGEISELSKKVEFQNESGKGTQPESEVKIKVVKDVRADSDSTMETQSETGKGTLLESEVKTKVKKESTGKIEEERSDEEKEKIKGVSTITVPLKNSNSESALSTGDFILSSGTQNYPISDLGYRWVQLWTTSSLPSNAVVTNLQYRLRIDDTGDPNTFYCGDYEIWLSSEAHGSPNKYIRVYDNLGGRTDGGNDDDTEDDSDIYISYRSTSAFNGENPAQNWCVWIEDNCAGDAGELEYIQFQVYWEAEVTKPDLISDTGWWKSNDVFEFDDFWFRARIKNNGTAAAGASHVRMFLSLDDDWDVTDGDLEVLPKKPVSSLAAGDDENVQWDFTFPSMGTEPYDVSVLVMVDCDGEVDESNEVNLYKWSKIIHVLPKVTKPDLISVSTAWKSSDVREGDSFWIKPKIKNIGDATAGASHVRLYLSPGDDFDLTDDTEISPKKAVPSLAVGEENDPQWDFNFPDMGSGDYDVWVVKVVDCDGEVDESNENNIYKTAVPIHVGGDPDINVRPTALHIYQH